MGGEGLPPFAVKPNTPGAPRLESQATRGRHALRTLRHRDFRLLWIGLLLSTVGDQMQLVAIMWHVYVLTDSPLYVGLIGLARFIPIVTLSLVAGAAADLVDRKRILLISQGAQMGLAALLTLATAGGLESVWLILVVTLLVGVASSFDSPARQAMIVNLVPPSELSNAITLHSLLRQTANIVGPAVGGLAIASVGLAATYGLNAASFVAVIVAVMLMKPLAVRASEGMRSWSAVLGGLQFARSEPLILSILLLNFLVTVFGKIQGLLPVFARDILLVGPEGLGLLHAASAAGAVVGASLLGTLGGSPRPVLWMLLGFAARGLCVIGLGLSPVFALSLLFLFGNGVADVVSEVYHNTVVMLRTPDHLRGRLAALHVLFAQGGPQLGILQLGALASVVGAVPAAMLGGVGVVLISAGFSRIPAVRRAVS